MKDRAVLVTGAASGIGRATACALARLGAQVVCADIDAQGGEHTVALLRQAGAQAAFEPLDVTDPEAHVSVVAAAQRRFGGLRVAVNNAGISVGPTRTYPPIGEVDIAEWHAVLRVNLDGVFYGLRAQLPAMAEAGGGAGVNVSSIMGQVAKAGLAPYATSKHAVIGLTRVAALDYAALGVRVNAVGPGYVDTPMLSRKDAASRAAQAARHPLGRLGRPEEVADLIAWLCSDQASFVTGSFHAVDGGYLAQ